MCHLIPLRTALFLVGVLALSIPHSLPAGAQSDSRTMIAVEALSRLKGMDLESNPAIKAAVLRVLETTRGTPQFVEIVRDFQIQGQNDALLEFAVAHPESPAAVEALRVILASDETGRLREALSGEQAAALVLPLGKMADRSVLPLLESLLDGSAHSLEVRKGAVRGLAQSQEGAALLLSRVRQEKLSADLNFTAAAELHMARWPAVKAEALELLPLPQGQDAAPLPPVRELVERSGDPRSGAEVFEREAVGCNKCHVVHGRGVDYGPNLSEIGTKLGKDALYEAILDPNSGISFGYEGWEFELKNGEEIFGLISSETADEIAVKTQTGLITTLRKSEIERRVRQTTSVMPSGLQAALSVQELVDLVEYLSTLRKTR
jgi:putative heme-binding domain-containing protein